MSLPDRIMAGTGPFDTGTPYLRLDGPTLQAVREALRLAGEFNLPDPDEEFWSAQRKISAALKLLEGK